MKLFARTGGHWLFWVSAVYFTVAMYSMFVEKFAPIELIQLVWLCIIALPVVCNPLARWLNMRENNMFDKLFFKKPSNVVPFPEPKGVPNVPYIEPPAPPKKEPKTYYTFGITDDNRVSFTMGYTTLTMTRLGVDQLIEQLEFYRDRLPEDENAE